MSLRPATYELLVPQRASLSETIRVPFDGTGVVAVAQVWDSDKRRRLFLDLTVTWINRREQWDNTDPTKIRATLNLFAGWQQTRAVIKPGYWDLLWVWPDGLRDYILEGPTTVNLNVSEAAS
jgi:hypothetical protein